MVAETLTATRAKTGFPVGGVGPATALHVATGTYEIAANVEDGDIFEMCKIPANAVVVGGYVCSEELDTNATETLDMDIGWAANGTDAADPDGFGNLGVWTGDTIASYLPAGGLLYPLQGVILTAGPKKFAAETTIQVEANAAAATGGTGTLTVVVYYFLDPSFTV
jgi:hypothetical protein